MLYKKKGFSNIQRVEHPKFLCASVMQTVWVMLTVLQHLVVNRPIGQDWVLSPHLSQPPGFSFRLQKCQHISFSDWALHVPDDGAVAVVHELNTDLQGEQEQETT